jgi:N-acetyl-1-D-myo-inositol-2-amino-2-deoxy-alpha-D-glucopyranoside deacetylase
VVRGGTLAHRLRRVTSAPGGGRLLLVHAHPDDETIGTGATMARYAAEGMGVTLVTCTLGEEGEVILPEVSHLAADQDDRLGEHRQDELAAAMAALGVHDFRFLGGPGTYRDSGMMGTPANDRATCFWRSDLLEASSALVSVLREVRPHVLVTYDDFGGYGHPDHIQAHRVATYATALAAAPSFRPDLGEAWDVPKVYWSAFPRSVLRAGIEALRAAGDTSDFAAMDPDDLPFACDDALVTTRIVAPEFLEAKMAAMRAHATQISVDGGFFALSDNVGSRALGTEYFRLVKGRPGGIPDSDGFESDLFAGVLTAEG